MPLFDRDAITDEAWNRYDLGKLNQIFDHLAKLKIEHIVCPPPGTAPRTAVTAVVLAQSLVYRAIEQAESAVLLSQEEKWISAITVARSLLETVALNEHFVAKLQEVTSKGDLGEIQQLVQNFSFATRLDKFIEQDETGGVKAQSILTAIDKMNRTIRGARSSYDFLCEFAHPNSFGTFLFYADEKEGKFIFNSEGHGCDSFEHITTVISTVGLMVFSYRNVLSASKKIRQIELSIKSP